MIYLCIGIGLLVALFWWLTQPAKPYEGFGLFVDYQVAGSSVSNGR